MIDIKRISLGIFFFIPTIMVIYLAYLSFFEMNDIELGFISLFGTFMLGGMSFLSFKGAFEDVIKSKENKK